MQCSHGGEAVDNFDCKLLQHESCEKSFSLVKTVSKV